MIEVVFTLDYEIYGNGYGSLKELVYEPSVKLKEIFAKWSAPLVVFVEAAELERIECERTDPAIGLVIDQIRNFYENGWEIGLHLHPQWYNAYYKNGIWMLNYEEYNLCLLNERRIKEIIDRSLGFLRKVIGDPKFIPLSFRAGNWLLQPTNPIAEILATKGIKIDSSVFKGGRQRYYCLDYRSSLKNGYYWKFRKDVNKEDPLGILLEVPIYTEMVPIWELATLKRIKLQRRASVLPARSDSFKRKIARLRDLFRFNYPLKLDFCRLTLPEALRMIEKVVKKDKKDPSTFKPIVAIGHTKDLTDLTTVDSMLTFLRQKEIPISTLRDLYVKCL